MKKVCQKKKERETWHACLSANRLVVYYLANTSLYFINTIRILFTSLHEFHFNWYILIISVFVFFLKQKPVCTPPPLPRPYPLPILRLLISVGLLLIVRLPQAGAGAGSVLRRWVAICLQWLWLVLLSSNIYRFDGLLSYCLLLLELLCPVIFK